MDIITVLQPENRTVNRHSFSHSKKNALFPAVLSALREVTPAAARLIPVCIPLVVALMISLAPLVQERFGVYRVGPIGFSTDSMAEFSMRRFILPENSHEGEGDSVSALPPSIIPVTYSEYRVRNGDTVSAIASRFGLRNISTVLAVNKIDNARRIRSGQTLSIPSMDGIVHTVTRGENLAAVAARYRIPVNALLDANDLSVASLQIGQKLFVPGGTLSTLELRRAMGELFVFPLRGRLTSPYGYRNDPFTGIRTFHTGIDLAAPTGTAVRSTLDGRVSTTGYSPVYGNYIIISHDDGYQSLYGHLSSIGVRRGSYVTQSAIIGRVGNTGYSTGSHLHFSVYKNGRTINPQTVLK